jgi:hypothetical protein
MTMGPVDVITIGFPGNKFTGRIAPALMKLVDSGVIRVLDLLFVQKDAQGALTTLEIEDLDAETGAAFMSLTTSDPDALNDEDAEDVGENLPLNSSALLIAFENTWAQEFVAACEEADAVVIDQVRIPAAVVNVLVTSA